jgi:hypothetical protein
MYDVVGERVYSVTPNVSICCVEYIFFPNAPLRHNTALKDKKLEKNIAPKILCCLNLIKHKKNLIMIHFHVYV